MLGMAGLEWPLCSPPRFVHPVTPLATSARHSAWRISRGEAQFAQTTKHILQLGYQDGFYTSELRFWTGSSQNECPADFIVRKTSSKLAWS